MTTATRTALAMCCTLTFGVQAGNAQMECAQVCTEFQDSSLDDWSEKSFVGNTDYSLVMNQRKRVLRASTSGQASVLFKKTKVDIDRTPWLGWSWKVENIYDNIDEKSRAGDDFPARLYVVAKTGFLPWDTLAINYVWSSALPVGSVWSNPHTRRSRMVAVQSGPALTGKWIQQRRNVAEDFRDLFGETVNEIRGYAVMVDGDNADKQGTAFFGGIHFSAN